MYVGGGRRWARRGRWWPAAVAAKPSNRGSDDNCVAEARQAQTYMAAAGGGAPSRAADWTTRRWGRVRAMWRSTVAHKHQEAGAGSGAGRIQRAFSLTRLEKHPRGSPARCRFLSAWFLPETVHFVCSSWFPSMREAGDLGENKTILDLVKSLPEEPTNSINF